MSVEVVRGEGDARSVVVRADAGDVVLWALLETEYLPSPDGAYRSVVFSLEQGPARLDVGSFAELLDGLGDVLDTIYWEQDRDAGRRAPARLAAAEAKLARAEAELEKYAAEDAASFLERLYPLPVAEDEPEACCTAGCNCVTFT